LIPRLRLGQTRPGKLQKKPGRKTAVITQLQDQVANTTLSQQKQEVYSRLLQSTILTEEQSTAFKTLLDKLHPGFFYRLKKTYPAITIAEQRMAALIKLKLATREIAAMPGISVNSVHKTRQRLKQRLSLATEANLEEFIAGLERFVVITISVRAYSYKTGMPVNNPV
jgi:DNA-binding CsgD family transcriptional regulator